MGILLYGLLDYVVDTHFELVQSLDTEIETLEDQLFDDNPRDKEMQRRTFGSASPCSCFRACSSPCARCSTAAARDLHVVDGEILPYFHDVYDHVLGDRWTESLRDLVTTILDHLTVRGTGST